MIARQCVRDSTAFLRCMRLRQEAHRCRPRPSHLHDVFLPWGRAQTGSDPGNLVCFKLMRLLPCAGLGRPLSILHALDQFYGREVGHVAVSGGERRVAELLLDDWDRYAFHHQFVCVGVTQAMRMNAFLNVSLFREAWQKRTWVGGLQRFALEGAKQRCLSFDPEGASGIDPAAEDRHRSWIKADDPSAIPFAVKHGERPHRRIDILWS